MSHNEKLNDIDEGLYSRQLYVYGTDGMRRLCEIDILLIGLDGLGVEIAKNVILAGVKSITLYDNNPLNFKDLSTNYYGRIEDIGQPRSTVCQKQLTHLNDHVKVKIVQKIEINDLDYFKKFQIIILTQSSHNLCIKYGDLCHNLGIKLIIASTFGLFGKVFCDFGEEFIVHDKHGVDLDDIMIENIDQSEEGMVTCIDNTHHYLNSGDYVKFSNINGMIELNNCEPKQVTVKDLSNFYIGDTRNYSQYKSNGVCKLIKMPTKINFNSYRNSFLSPQFMSLDCEMFDYPNELHLYFKAINDFCDKNDGTTPRPWNKNDAYEFLNCVEKVNNEFKNTNLHIESINKKFCLLFACVCSGQLGPIQSIIGSIAAQEVIKACTGKYMPLKQWAYFHAIECLPKNYKHLDENDLFMIDENDAKPLECRYDGQIQIFGKHFHKKIQQLKYFIVGCGAVGCELLKNCAQLGIGTDPNGKIYVTDMDTIERSNLNRQFLFRPQNIGQYKSITAEKVIKLMNPELNIEAHINELGPQTESIYDNNFFESIDAISNALDTDKGRTYICDRCVENHKPFINCGTEGLSASLQTILPKLTHIFVPNQELTKHKSVALCTIKTFPYHIEHTIQWARELFEDLFVKQTNEIHLFKQNPSEYLKETMEDARFQNLDKLEELYENLCDKRPVNFEDCIRWARNLFEELFVDNISQLIDMFPEDYCVDEIPFWTSSKRFPQVFKFDPSNLDHIDFIIASSNIRAYCFQIPQLYDRDHIMNLIQNIQLPTNKSKRKMNIILNDEDLNEYIQTNLNDNDYERLKFLNEKLSTVDMSEINVNLFEFEKDDDTNFHIDFITSASNLRALNYHIPPVDRLKTKKIAGNISPTVATSSSCISALVTLEIIKIAQGLQDLTVYRSSFFLLSLPHFSFFEPIEPQTQKYNNIEFTPWDRLEFNDPLTLKDLNSHFENNLKLSIRTLLFKEIIIYARFMNAKQKELIMDKTLKQLWETIPTNRKPIKPQKSIRFHVFCTTFENKNVDVPPIRYVL